jgi:hypothetical protein
VVSEKKIFRNPPIRNKNDLWWPCLLTNRDEMSNLYRGPSIHAFYQISVHLGKRFQRRRFFLEINQSEKRMGCGGHVCWRIGSKWAIFIEDLPRMLPTKFWFIWPSGFRGEDFLEINHSEKKGLWRPCLLTDRDKMSNVYRGPSIDASYQIPVHLGKWFQRRRFFRNQTIKNKNGLWRPYLLTDRS